MKHSGRLLYKTLCFLALFCGGVAASLAQSPEVQKLEPPSWWIGSSVNPVRVLIKGRNLFGMQVVPVGSGLRVAGTSKVSASGDYLFVDLAIAPNAQPGERTLKITNGSGSTTARFEILPRLDRAGRFQGFSPDDVMYLIMIDRFSDGDQTNNDPAQSRGLYDRKNKYYYHGGDLEGIIDHLSYFKELGVTALWLTPWYDNY
ncbi:MAG: neopullulanase, partial [Blastocatellia bacterium]|nr:neopullulanase [Blastocatellia bacterium]